MASKAKPSKGTRFQIGDGGSPTETFTTIAEILSHSGVPEEAPEIDVTSVDSTFREYISSGVPDSPDLTFELNWVGSSAQQQQLRTDLRAGTLRNFKLILNDHATTPSTCTFAAVVKGFDGPSIAVAEQYRATITIKRSGESTWTYAPS